MAASGSRWTRDELLLALNLYHRIPFSRYDQRTPEVIELAGQIGRTPSSIAYKLSNFAALDESIEQRGFANYSKVDEAIWREFQLSSDRLVVEMELARASLGADSLVPELEAQIPPDIEGTEREALVRVRINQSYFRRLILSRYESTCCITGLGVPELLVAAHIVPWAEAPEARMNPANGLCLNPLHDRAFELGLVVIDDELRVHLSGRLRDAEPSPAVDLLRQSDGQPLRLPPRVVPGRDFLRRHRERFAA